MVTLRFIAGVCGNVTALFLYFAPMVTVKRIINCKSTEQFSCVPYAMALLSCLLYTWYSLPFVTPNNVLISTIGGTGATIESIYVLIFIIYASKKEKARLLGLVMFVISVITTVALVSLFAVHGKSRKLLCGLLVTIFSIIMYASPLSVMKMVIKTKSVEYMPFYLSLSVFLCSTSWFVYGLLGRDPFVFVSNGLGTVLGIVQLILYAIYHNRKVESKNALDDGYLVAINTEKTHEKKPQDSTV